ncbi:2-polyprenyl-6-methoxyphenol hydroxylase-like FAD-dependent oxidoreductase [Streptomyces sp. TLI_171]|nr:2-polyprenyl-6-methoxyphenol hydroxylase-like FAD-dependent oxidoreductase [Streptomyces sp. TLI_171]
MTPGSGARSLRVLVAGGGVAGQALAFWLARGGHRVTVVERFPALRATGAQVDLRGQGIEAVRRMGLLDAVRDRLVDEKGVAFVDARGRARATIMANTSGQGRQTLTSEYEIMRGDLIRILHEATGPDVEHVFGRSVDGFEQDGHQVVAHFSDGSSGEFDLLVSADGQGSRIRRALLPEDLDPYWRVGIHMAYWFVPRTASDTDVRDTYMVPGGRQIMRRSHNPTETQVYFVLREESAEASAIHRQPVERQQEFWADRFRDAGWQTRRFVDGMRTSPFFYSQEVVQVRTDTWSEGRVVLAGDAAHCASPYSGMGVSGGLVGAYVLADALNRHPGDLPTALARYDSALRPFVDRIQAEVNPRLLRLGLPTTRRAVNAFRTATALACRLHLPDLAARLAKEDRGGDWQFPLPRPTRRPPDTSAARVRCSSTELHGASRTGGRAVAVGPARGGEGQARAAPRNRRTARTRRWSASTTGRSSLAKMLLMCFATALSLTTSACAMPALERPSAIRPSTSRSRGVSRASGSLSRRSSNCATTCGSRAVPPSATRRTAATNSATSATRCLSR